MGNVYDELIKGNVEGVKKGIEEALNGGSEPGDILNDLMIPAMEEVGRRFEEGTPVAARRNRWHDRGNSVMTDLSSTDLAEIRSGLAARLEDLKARLGDVEEELHSSHSQDFADQATEREQDEVLEGEEVIFEQEMAQIEAAMARIDAGTYGDCSKCGEAINPARLKVQPEAPLCMECAS